MAEEIGSGMYYTRRDPESSRRYGFSALLDAAQNLKQPTGEKDPPPVQESNADKYVG